MIRFLRSLIGSPPKPARLTGASAPGRHNIEVKARCRDLTRAAEAAREIGATRVGELRQCDTYFCAHGAPETARNDGKAGRFRP
jgi:hypothetical protein